MTAADLERSKALGLARTFYNPAYLIGHDVGAELARSDTALMDVDNPPDDWTVLCDDMARFDTAFDDEEMRRGFADGWRFAFSTGTS